MVTSLFNTCFKQDTWVSSLLKVQLASNYPNFLFQGYHHVHVQDVSGGAGHAHERLHEPAVVLPVRLRHVPRLRGRPLGPRGARHHRGRRQARVRKERRHRATQVCLLNAVRDSRNLACTIRIFEFGFVLKGLNQEMLLMNQSHLILSLGPS